MRKIGMAILALTLLVSSTGCSFFMKPYHEELLVDITTSETPFLVELEGENSQGTVETEEYLKSKLIFSRRVQIPYRWKQTHRYIMWENGSTGKWIPSAKLIVVDRAPVTREWVADSVNKSNDQGIWVESSDSIGFSTGITITARIEHNDDAIKFLYNYPPRANRQVVASGGDPFNVEVARLEEIMDTEIRGSIQTVFAEQAALDTMDNLREKKDEIIKKIREEVVPLYKERGITITNLGQFGGFTYENKETQDAIDNVFQAQQDQEVAKAEAKAAEERKVALKLLGEGEAAKALEIARGKSEAIRLEADAKAYETEQLQKNAEAYLQLKSFEVELKRLEKWNGQYPQYLIEGVPGNSLLQLPSPQGK